MILRTVLFLIAIFLMGCGNQTDAEGVERDLSGICNLLGVPRDHVKTPDIIWLKDDAAVQVHRIEFGKTKTKRLIAFYGVKYNTIYISTPDYRRKILWHELAHAVMCQSSYYSRFSVEQQEKMAKLVELAMHSYDREYPNGGRGN